MCRSLRENGFELINQIENKLPKGFDIGDLDLVKAGFHAARECGLECLVAEPCLGIRFKFLKQRHSLAFMYL